MELFVSITMQHFLLLLEVLQVRQKRRCTVRVHGAALFSLIFTFPTYFSRHISIAPSPMIL
jgi:hypothetical protein